ncbi:CDP-alcohol phosphatidyltransferase [Beutenbergia cavernae DSM 12333]|uniref:Phosphatidylinositol phosphate synthase n=1 Tax=Beutenbergia cavernae (strain ATCC BAA-8 / DSM 12333 / CCUG 43141 / JCM 11478 / NBRC 16432 / NCIMB 13614 / HKI 0122) TaxID=471853 RepID=C5C5P5_BEUC1|nr:CDP-alcohol phosphatidyltransferase family protein [Beutenbergia cavernae]ACQ80236.1 CDP-alcohol phosphatidyltransferase [Beutenbergia cavernae DSM 12333]
MLKSLRAAVTRIVTPLARALVRAGVSPDVVTVVGTLGAMAGALVLFPLGQLFAGVMVITFFVLFDVLDGTMARLAGRSGPWGAFLDSTLDRFADGAVFVGLAVYLVGRGDDPVGAAGALACLALGAIVPYARARAEGLGMHATVGIAERGDRLLIALVAAGIVGLGVPPIVLTVVLWALAAASLVTVVQRMVVVYRQARDRAEEA